MQTTPTSSSEPNETVDNIDAAMNHVAETLEPTRSPDTNTSENENANKQVLIRASELDHERWKQAAAKEGISLSEFIRNCCNKTAGNILECQHPMEMRKIYPWSEKCLSCGKRLR